MSRFEGKVVVVTGSSSGIGQGVLLGFAKEGASVVIHGTNKKRLQDTEALLKENGIPESRFLTIQGEIQDEKVQEKLIDSTIAKFGRLDVLVNNAGVGSKDGIIDLASIENFDYVMNVNFRAPYRLTQLALPYLKKTQGNVINTSSICAITKQSDPPMMPIYGASKAALDTWVKYDSGRLAKLGVRINNINPGPFLTNIYFRGMPDETSAEVKKDMLDSTASIITNAVPVKRWGKLEEIVPAYLLLADNNSSGFTIGSCWVIDGGMGYYGRDVDLTANE